MEDGRYSPHREKSDAGASEAQDSLSWEEITHSNGEDAAIRPPKKLPEGILAAEAIKKNPKAVFEHVAAAATRKEAVERLYELRQEVKDDPTTQPQAAPSTTGKAQTSTAIQIGKIIADANAAAAPPTPPAPSSPPPPQSPLAVSPKPLPDGPPEPDGPPPLAPAHSLYRKAVVTGFATALTLLVLFILFVVTR